MTRRLVKHPAATACLAAQVLDRLRYILEIMKVPSAVAPALSILQSCAVAGPETARVVLLTPGLLPLLVEFLEVRTPGRPPEPWAAAQCSARGAVLRLCRLLCEADSAAVAPLLETGIAP